jgi:hypothetical protein
LKFHDGQSRYFSLTIPDINKRNVRKTKLHNVVNKWYQQYFVKLQKQSKIADSNRLFPMFVLNLTCSPRLYGTLLLSQQSFIPNLDISYDPDKTHVEFLDWPTVLSVFHMMLNSFFEPATPIPEPEVPLELPLQHACASPDYDSCKAIVAQPICQDVKQPTPLPQLFQVSIIVQVV